MKKILFVFMPLLVLFSVSYAGLAPTNLPGSSYYNGQADRSFDLGSEGTLDIHLEFAVYRNDGDNDEAQTMMEMTGYSGDLLGSEVAFVYAYQIFCEDTSTAALTYFALTGINPDAISSVDTDISQIDSMTAPSNEVFDSEGVAPSQDGYFNDSATKAIWEFEDGVLVKEGQSWFLFLYSGSDWIAGDIEVQPVNDDIPVPNVPEPATLALLGCGAVLSLIRRK